MNSVHTYGRIATGAGLYALIIQGPGCQSYSVVFTYIMTTRRPRHPMPDFLRDALEEHGLRAAYKTRPPYQRNDYVGWITRAKREDTRQRRLAQMLDELRRGDVYMKMAWGGGRPGGNAKRSAPELAEDIREAFEAAGVLEAFRRQPSSHQR